MRDKWEALYRYPVTGTLLVLGLSVWILAVIALGLIGKL